MTVYDIVHNVLPYQLQPLRWFDSGHFLIEVDNTFNTFCMALIVECDILASWLIS